MNRRDILKTAGLAIAGSALLPLNGLAQVAKTENKENDVQPILSG